MELARAMKECILFTSVNNLFYEQLLTRGSGTIKVNIKLQKGASSPGICCITPPEYSGDLNKPIQFNFKTSELKLI